MDKKLEKDLRYSMANPDDHSSRVHTALSFLRAGRAKQACELLESVRESLLESSSWNPLAVDNRTVETALTVPALLLDAATIVWTRGDQDPVPFYEAASRGPESEFALASLEALVESCHTFDALALARLTSSVLRRDDSSAAKLLLSALEVRGKNLPAYGRLILAALSSRFGITTKLFEQETFQGIRKLANLPKNDQEAMPCPYHPPESRNTMERQPRRQFGAHGGDYEFGPVLALKMRLDHRFLLCDIALMCQIKDELSALADSFSLPPFEYYVFADGYGFSWPESLRPDEQLAKDFASLLNAWKIFPGIFVYDGRRPFDILQTDDFLTKRFQRDLATHSARSARSADGPFWHSPAMDLLVRVGPGGNSPSPDCEDLLARAREIYCEPGALALAAFYKHLSRGRQTLIPFSED